MKNDTYIDKTTLLRVYREIKNDPQKVFICKDLFEGHSKKTFDKYMSLLVSLEIVEKVKVYWISGFGAKRTTKGYRLLKK